METGRARVPRTCRERTENIDGACHARIIFAPEIAVFVAVAPVYKRARRLQRRYSIDFNSRDNDSRRLRSERTRSRNGGPHPVYDLRVFRHSGNIAPARQKTKFVDARVCVS